MKKEKKVLNKTQKKKLREKKNKLINSLKEDMEGDITNEAAADMASKWITIADVDGNGTIDFEEFKEFFNKL